jgi:hypothetical protein
MAKNTQLKNAKVKTWRTLHQKSDDWPLAKSEVKNGRAKRK